MEMAMKPTQNPDRKITFFKVLMGDYMEKIMIPPAFVMKYEKIMPETIKLKSYNVGKSSMVSVKSNDDGFFIKHGWKKFVKDHNLEVGDFLVFNLVNDTTFEVLIYGPTCCLKKIKLADDDDHVDQNKNSTSKFTSTASGSKQISFKKRACPKLSQFKRPRGSAKKTGKKAKRPRIFKGKTEVNKKESIAEEETKHPCVKLVLKEYQKYNVVVPRRFADKIGLQNKRKTVIEDPLGRQWPVFVNLVGGNQVHLSTGWSAFYQANRLVTGDILSLHSRQVHGNLINVEIQKGGGEIAKAEPALLPKTG
ncbi:putative B3 domain-containing protein Os03g0621600 [Ricinus communis]|uniref:TF-B3 domain-containing protein n=1 Tax=Ricinus communis TaxID=3988 RepID=B9S8P6_RICCO|nr:putative B3 domain-containing protein Os03g0621600 [Ricinus communis]EEF40049.1 conserved hypothetical protein [Ricinus communis]|eukprot:XP_002522365.1 putative B3 domain-containing protein Os03g0621600 isoform X1 [Ricinus communis]